MNHARDRPGELASFRTRAMSVIDKVFGGEHHVQSLKWKDNIWSSCTFLTFESQLSTFDFSHLTRLVVVAHDEYLRAAVSGGGPRMMKILLSERKQGTMDPVSGGCPTLEAHIAAIREGGNRAMQQLYDSMRAEDAS